MKASSLLGRLALLTAVVSALCAAPSLWQRAPATSLEIVGANWLVMHGPDGERFLEVEVRARLSRRARFWCLSEDESWLDLEHRTGGGWVREVEFYDCGFGITEYTLPAHTEVLWTEVVTVPRGAERETRFVLDVECPTWFGLSSTRDFAASESFRPSELLARFP